MGCSLMEQHLHVASIGSRSELLLVAVRWIFYRPGMKDGEL
jgi:hypothetical protein